MSSTGSSTIEAADFQLFALTCEAIRSTRSKLEKVRILAEYLNKLEEDGDLKIAVTFLAGRVFPPGEAGEINVGYSILWNVISELTQYPDIELSKHFLKHGDLGSVAEEVLSKKVDANGNLSFDSLTESLYMDNLTLPAVYSKFRELAKVSGSRSIERKRQLLLGLLSSIRLPIEAKYIVRILTSEMRIGLVGGLVEEALAKAFKKIPAEIRRVNLIMSDPGQVAILAKHDRLADATVLPLRPTNFMLADNAPNADDLCKKFKNLPVISEYKYDGIRAQVHVKDEVVRIFSRNLAEVGRFFPEIEEAASKLNLGSKGLILDGEIIAYRNGSPLSFQLLQRRLRKLVRAENDAPIIYLAFDLIYFGESLLEWPLSERVSILRNIVTSGPAISFSQQRQVSSAYEIVEMFLESKKLGYEGLVVKDLSSKYTPGRRGSSWVKLKKELDTLDVVIVAAEYGHGKRAGVISDYTFAVSDGADLKVIGKAYSGLTDLEINEMTKLLKSITIQDFGYRRIVKPQVVLEVAFDAIQRSDRHNSGYALRFPRIKMIRGDKSVLEIDTLERVKQIYEGQKVKV